MEKLLLCPLELNKVKVTETFKPHSIQLFIEMTLNSTKLTWLVRLKSSTGSAWPGGCSLVTCGINIIESVVLSEQQVCVCLCKDHEKSLIPRRLRDRPAVQNLPDPGDTRWDRVAGSHLHARLQAVLPKVGPAGFSQSGASPWWRWERIARGKTISFFSSLFSSLNTVILELSRCVKHVDHPKSEWAFVVELLLDICTSFFSTQLLLVYVLCYVCLSQFAFCLFKKDEIILD